MELQKKKKILLSIVVIPLMVIELSICTGFLPVEWQHTISERIPWKLSESPNLWSLVTHPRTDLEMEDVFREHLSLRIASYIFIAILLAVNSILIRVVWKRARAIKGISADRA